MLVCNRCGHIGVKPVHFERYTLPVGEEPCRFFCGRRSLGEWRMCAGVVLSVHSAEEMESALRDLGDT